MPRTCVWASNPLAFTVDDPRVQPITETGCWIWTGAVQDKNAPDSKKRGTLLRNAVQMPAYRAFYEKRHGSIGPMHLHHVCRTPLCCNPDHLEPIGAVDHARQHFTETGAYRVSAAHAAKAVCPRCGGAYSRDGATRRCRPCANVKRRERMARRKELV